jgi:hypothetical protein
MTEVQASAGAALRRAMVWNLEPPMPRPATRPSQRDHPILRRRTGSDPPVCSQEGVFPQYGSGGARVPAEIKRWERGDHYDWGSDPARPHLPHQFEPVHAFALIIDDEAIDLGKVWRLEDIAFSGIFPDLVTFGFERKFH